MLENLKKLNTGRIRVKAVAVMLVMILTFANFTFLGSCIGKESYAVDTSISKQNDSNVKFASYLDSSDKNVKEHIADTNSEEIETTLRTDKISEDDLDLSQEIITNRIYEINGEAKRVIQVLVKSSIKENVVPVKRTNIEINVPKIEAFPEQVKVASYNTKATNGKKAIEFADLETSKWEYNKNEGKVSIQIENPLDERGNISWEKDAQDEIIVTYIYAEDVEITPFISDVKAKVEIYGVENSIVVEKMSNLKLEELQEFGDIAKIENQISPEIYKGKLYINEVQSYAQICNIYVSYKELANKIQVEDLGDEISGAGTYYKKTAINKKEAINVLGEKGIIEIYNAETKELIQSIDLSEETKEDYIIVQYDEKVQRILIGTSKAEKEGKIEIINQKEIKTLEESSIQEINELISNINLLVADEGSKVVANINSRAEAKLVEPKTQYSISLDKTKLVTGIENDLQITAELKTENSSDKLFANPEIRIELPVEITKAKIENITPILHSEELKLKSYEVITNKAGNKEIVIQTKGVQTKYTQNNAYVVIDLKVETEALIASKDASIKIVCINEEEKLEDIKNIELISKDESIANNILSIGSKVPELREQIQKMQMQKAAVQEAVKQETVEIKISPKAMTEDLYQGQIVTYEITIKNNTVEDLENPKIIYTVPEGAVLTELTYSQASNIVYTDKENIAHRTITFEGTLEAGKTRVAKVTLRIKKDASQIVHNIEAQNTEGKTIGTFTSNAIPVKKGDLSVMISRRDNWESNLKEGSFIQGIVIVTNNTNKEMKNLKITSKLPDYASWVEDSEYNKNWTYNKQTREISCVLNSLTAGKTDDIWFEIKVDKINNYEEEINNMALVEAENGDKFASNIYTNRVNKAGYKIAMESTSSKTLKEGENIKYIINVTNIGKRAEYITLIDEVPEDIYVQKVTYYYDGEKKEEEINGNIVNVSNYIEIGKTMTVEIEGKVNNLENAVTNKKITNISKVISGSSEFVSNSVITTIVKNPNNPSRPEQPNDPSNPEKPEEPEKPSNPENPEEPEEPTTPQEPINPGEDKTTYSISGMVWLDKNKDGIREKGEEEVQSQRILLLDEKGKVIKETKSSLTGTYKFVNLEKGKYLVAIAYDKDKYGVTKYQVEEAKESENSDIVAKQIKLGGKNVQVGITDTIKVESKNINSIDMGLIENPVFDLSLNKRISKIVVTTSKEVKTYEYEDLTNLAKVEISKKEISGASLLVEYEIEIVNEGDVEGYVTDIIDYLPKELTFSSEINPDWYKSEDNNLHYMALEPKAIAPGESQKIKLILTKNLKNDSVGTIENIAEIGESTNLEGIIEKDSVAGNKQEGEDDISKAELIISIKTGEPVFYIGIVVVSMLAVGIGIYVIKKFIFPMQ